MTGPRIEISGDVIRWAREQRGLSIEVAAKRLNISETKLLALESNDQEPTIAQLRKMCDVYQRPLIVLMLEDVPISFQPLADFRSLPEAEKQGYSPELRDAIRRATAQREIFSELNAEMGREVVLPALPADHRDAGTLAEGIRTILGVTFDLQQRWRRPEDAYAEWRSRIEELDVLVLEASRVAMRETRGFSLSDGTPFVIVANGQDSARGKIFTLLHEMAHLCVRRSGVCDFHYDPTRRGDLEVFCNAVAGLALLPEENLRRLAPVRNHQVGQRWSDQELNQLEVLAGGASKEAILRRLVQIKMSTREEYEARRDEFLEAYEQFRRNRNKGGQGPPPHRIQLRDRGRPFVRSVFDAYSEGLVSLSEVVDFAGVRVKHLSTLEREAFR